MNINQLKSSRFLSKSDCGAGIVVTIKDARDGDCVTQENVAMETQAPEMKWCIHFVELDKPLVLNSINNQMLFKITGSEETSDWIGHKVVLYDDQNVSFQGRITGGVRIRAPRKTAAAPSTPAAPVNPARRAPAPPAPAAVEEDQDMPF